MKKLLLVFLLAGCGAVFAQKPLPEKKLTRATGDLIFLPAKGTVCYATGQADSRIGPPIEFLRARAGRTSATQADISVTYVDFSDSAKAAFQYAVDIWKSLLVTPVTIRVYARWEDLNGYNNGSIVLGGASPASYVTGFSGATKASTAYPIALAEKLARRNLNGDAYDITCSFNSNKQVNWYLGTDGATKGSAGRQDLVTVVLHELGHGLGFTSSFFAENSLAVWGDGNNYGYPRIYDHYLVNGTNQQLIDNNAFSNPSNDLYKQVTSNNLFFNSPLAIAANNNQKPKVYAPSSYAKGSSISHLDESTYPNGNANALMTPSLARGEVNQNPGPIVLNFFSEMGWKATSILHDRLRDSEDLIGQPITVRATVKSDTTLKGNVTLSYTVNDTTRAKATTVPMTQSGENYTADIPAASGDRTIRYWISAADNANRTVSSPAEAPARAYWTFKVGTDKTPPTITHVPQTELFATTDSLYLDADVFDDYDFGIDTTYIEYRINGAAKPSVAMPRQGYYVVNGIRSNNIYALGALVFPAGTLKGGDVVEYRIVARDRSKARNQAMLPATGYFSITVKGINAAVTEYVNNFNGTDAGKDFTGTGFKIDKPATFADGAIHSDHPYKDGPASQGNKANITYTLLTPIKLSDQDPFIRFDEVCLVEPGEAGSVFGSSDFYDYVVVEGSKNGGKTWIPFEDGWDARSNSEWLSAYNSNLERITVDGFAVQNSKYEGNAGLFRRRQVNMMTYGDFSPGDNVLIRFRLFSDQYAHGWGWAIDNLYIQKAVPVVTSTDPGLSRAIVSVNPNPSTDGEFRIDAKFPASAKSVDITVTNLTGQTVYQRTVSQPGVFRDRLDLRTLTPGTYVARFQTETEVITRRLIIVR